MSRLHKVAEVLAAHGQHTLAREVAEVSRRVEGSERAATTEVALVDLPPTIQRFAEVMGDYFGEVTRAYESLYGVILHFRPGTTRISKGALKAMAAYRGIQWVHTYNGEISVGIEGE